MTGNEQIKPIGAVGAGNCSHCGGGTYFRRYGFVTLGSPIRNALQLAPDAFLEISASQRQRYGEFAAGAGKVFA
jgi:hypothetical protein